jgi:hypothetical protein
MLFYNLFQKHHPLWLTFLSCYATFALNALIELRIGPFDIVSSSISKSFCSPSQTLGEFPKYLLNQKAVSAVILRFPLSISEILVWGISKSFASL